MKKHFGRVLAVIMTVTSLFALSGCGAAQSTVSASEAATQADSNETVEVTGDEIRVGLLSSSSGGTVVNDTYIADSFKMAVDEVNAAGGINGKKILVFEEDYACDPATAVEKATKLIVDDKVSCIFGVVFSSVRIAVMDVVEEYNNLLIYPTDHEGLEQSNNILYLGCIPNQSTAVVAPWISENLGKKIYLLGNDYIFPRSTCAQARALFEGSGCEIVGEEYVALDETDYSNTIAKIKSSGADVVYAVVVGDCVNTFTMQMHEFGVDKEVKIFDAVLDEAGAAAIGGDAVEGVYSGMAYYATIDSEANKAFRDKVESKFGYTPTVSSASAYTGAYLLFQALEEVGEQFTTQDLIEAFCKQSFDGPSGKVTMNENHYASLYPRIGQANSDCLFDVIYTSEEAITPDPWAGEALTTE